MRKLCHTGAALLVLLPMSMAANAADVTARPAPYAPPPPVYVPPPFSWTGFYIGVNVGGAWGQRNVTDSLLAGPESESLPNVEKVVWSAGESFSASSRTVGASNTVNSSSFCPTRTRSGVSMRYFLSQLASSAEGKKGGSFQLDQY
jgi:hypothetical protein